MVDSALDYDLCNFGVKVLTYIEGGRLVNPVFFLSGHELSYSISKSPAQCDPVSYRSCLCSKERRWGIYEYVYGRLHSAYQKNRKCWLQMAGNKLRLLDFGICCLYCYYVLCDGW